MQNRRESALMNVFCVLVCYCVMWILSFVLLLHVLYMFSVLEPLILLFFFIFHCQTGPADISYKNKCVYVCLCVCVWTEGACVCVCVCVCVCMDRGCVCVCVCKDQARAQTFWRAGAQ